MKGPAVWPCPMRRRNPEPALQGALWALLALLSVSAAWADDELLLKSAAAVNEGPLHFLATPPDKPVHHHQNRIVIDADSLASGWVSLQQCHDNLDAVGRAQITFREGFVRDLRVDLSQGIEEAWIEGPSVQLRQITPGSRLCLSAQTRALRDTGGGYFNLNNGPYMRRFLDGYYPMRVSLDVTYPQDRLKLIDISPAATPGLRVNSVAGKVVMDALFEGELRTLIQFSRP